MQNRWKKGKSEVKWRFTYGDMARVRGVKVGTVRRDVSKGLVDARDLESVARYVLRVK